MIIHYDWCHLVGNEGMSYIISNLPKVATWRSKGFRMVYLKLRNLPHYYLLELLDTLYFNSAGLPKVRLANQRSGRLTKGPAPAKGLEF